MTNLEAGRANVLRRERMVLAGIGLALVGAGFAVTSDANARRSRGVGTARWVTQGTLGLTLFNAGLSVFGEGVARRALELYFTHDAEPEPID